jgi:Fe2+ transport system protein FeoA
VWDDDPDLLRALNDLGLAIGAHVRVEALHPSLGTITVSHSGTQATLAIGAAHAIRVTHPAPAQS